MSPLRQVQGTQECIPPNHGDSIPYSVYHSIAPLGFCSLVWPNRKRSTYHVLRQVSSNPNPHPNPKREVRLSHRESRSCDQQVGLLHCFDRALQLHNPRQAGTFKPPQSLLKILEMQRKEPWETAEESYLQVGTNKVHVGHGTTRRDETRQNVIEGTRNQGIESDLRGHD